MVRADSSTYLSGVFAGLVRCSLLATLVLGDLQEVAHARIQQGVLELPLVCARNVSDQVVTCSEVVEGSFLVISGVRNELENTRNVGQKGGSYWTKHD